MLIKVSSGSYVEENGLAADGAAGAGTPRLGIADQWGESGRQHVRAETLKRPAAAERPPGFQMCVGKAPFVKFVAGVFFGPLEVG